MLVQSNNNINQPTTLAHSQQQHLNNQNNQNNNGNAGIASDSLGLSRMKLKDISLAYIFTNKLRCLNVSENLLSEISIELIEATPVLAVADFSFNCLTKLPNEINKWRQMNTLKLDRNNLVALPSTITDLLELVNLSLSSNLLEELPNLTDLPMLKNLSLAHNPTLPAFITKTYAYMYPVPGSTSTNKPTIKEIDSNLTPNLSSSQNTLQVPQITYQASNSSDDSSSGNSILNGPGNSALSPVSRLPTSKLPTQIISINVSPLQSPHSESGTPNAISNSKNNKLDLEGSQFTYFPFKIEHTKLCKLPRLLLGKNYKIDFERCLPIWASFKSLKVLSLDHCQLTKFPIGVCNIPSLRRLNLKKNQISIIPCDIKKLSKLKRIDLSYNHLDLITEDVAQLTLLKSININSNRFKNVQSLQPLASIETLEKISLNHNQLTEFPTCFLVLPLHTLYLDHNEISIVPPEVKQWKTLKDFSITNNNPRKATTQESISQPTTTQIEQPILQKIEDDIPTLQSISISNTQSGSLQISSLMEQLCLSPNSITDDQPVSPSSQTPMSPFRRPPKPLPIPPSISIANNTNPIISKPRGYTVASPTKISHFTSPTQQQINSAQSKLSERPKVPPLMLSKNSLSITTSIPNNMSSLAANDDPPISMLSSSISNDHLSKLSGMNTIGLGARVRSFTSYEYTEHETNLMHTTSSSSGDSWQDEDGHQDPTSPNAYDGHHSRGNLTKSTSVFTSPRGSKEKRSKISDFFSLAKDTLTLRKKNQQSAPNISNKQQQVDTFTPRNTSTACTSSPSTPRPSFPERNGSNSSLGNNSNTGADSPTHKKRVDRKISSSISNSNLSSIFNPNKDQANHAPVMNNLIRHSSHNNINANMIVSSYVNTSQLSQSVNPFLMDPTEDDSLNRPMSYYSGAMGGAHMDVFSQSMPTSSSILMDTSHRDDNIYTDQPNPTQRSSSSSSNNYRKSPPMVDQPAPASQKMEMFKQSKLEFVEELFVDDKSMVIPSSSSKKRLTALVLPSKHSQSLSSTLLPNGGQTRKSSGGEPSKRKLKKREETGGPLRESTSTGNLTSSIFLEGDDFIRDLMASPVINVDIEFTSEEGVPKIKAATLKMLINVLCHEKGQSKDLENMFFDTYRLFTNVETIIQLLSERFYHTGKNNSPIIKQKVLRFVQRWVDRNWEDFNEKQSASLLDFCKTCQETVEQGMPTSTYSIKNQITSLTNIIRMRCDGTYEPDEEQESWEQPPIPEFVYQENFTILDLKSHEVARQLSIIDQTLIRKITKHELLDYVQSQSNPPQSIVNVTNRFNYISRWVASEITTCHSLEKRIMLIFKFINIALNCWALKNFNSALAIIAGMKHGAVLRLKATWFYINNSKASSLFQEFEEMISPTSLSKLRKIMDVVEPPAVPYLGSYFNHLVGITEGNKSTKSSDQINLLKYEMLSKILQRVHIIQSKTYNLASVGVIQKFLNDLPQLTEAQLYESVSKLDTSRDIATDNSRLKWIFSR